MNWINTIADSVEKAFETVRPALKSIPPLLLICELYRRPGLSAIALTSSIIRRLPEAGIETGTNADGSQNKVNAFVKIFCEEFINEIKTNAKVTCVIEPGAIVSNGTGTSPSGPVVVQTINSFVGKTIGLIE